MMILPSDWWRQKKGAEKIFLSLGLLFILIGIVLRFYQITANDFIFYDEGYYLNYNRELMEIIAHYQVRGGGDGFQPFLAFLRASLAGAKALWFLVVNSRVYFAGVHAWHFPRLVSACAGVLTLGLTFWFARRFFQSKRVAWLAVVFLAILPSHVFYSRLGLQEALSTLLVLAGFYFHLFQARLSWRTFLSGILFAAAFFSNYRLIILPILVLLIETWHSLSFHEKWRTREVLWTILTFFSCVFFIGNLDGAKNTIITFGWMFHQANLAQKSFDPVNLLSFPYYVFRLENFLFGLLLFGNLYLVYKRQWRMVGPFLLVCAQMLIFSFASEKGARYLCVMTPFMAMAAAVMMETLWQHTYREIRLVAVVALALMTGFMTIKSTRLAIFRSDYRPSAEYLLGQWPGPPPPIKFLSTQNYVQNLYVTDPQRVVACPHRFEDLVRYYSLGYRYLVLCPQVYISWTENEERFNPKLKGYLRFIQTGVKPLKTYPHFNHLVLERFVFDHNENLRRSIRFLQLAEKQGLGQIRVYDLAATLHQVRVILSGRK